MEYRYGVLHNGLQTSFKNYSTHSENNEPKLTEKILYKDISNLLQINNIEALLYF